MSTNLEKALGEAIKKAPGAGAPERSKLIPLLVLVAVVILILFAAVLRTVKPELVFVVNPFVLPQGLPPSLTVDGTIVVDLLADEMEMLLKEGPNPENAQVPGRARNSRQVQVAFPPLKTGRPSAKFETAGISFGTEFVAYIWSEVRQHRREVTGDAYFDRINIKIGARIDNEKRQESNEAPENLRVASRKLALLLLSNTDLTPEIKGRVLLNGQDYSGAIAVYTGWSKANPKAPQPYFDLGVALYFSGDLEKANAAFKQALSLKPDFPEALLALGNIFYDQGKFKEAKAKYNQAIGLNPKIPEAHSNLGNALAEEGNITDAVNEYRKAVELRPGDPVARILLGSSLAELGEVEEAMANYKTAADANPREELPELHLVWGFALTQLNQTENATREFNTAVGGFQRERLYRPSNPRSLLNLGWALASLGRSDEAIPLYRKLVQIDPSFVDAWVSLGDALEIIGKYDEAGASYRRAIEIALDYYLPHLRLGMLERELRHCEIAIREFEIAQSLNPKEKSISDNLSQTRRGCRSPN